MTTQRLIRIRTITAFVTLSPDDFHADDSVMGTTPKIYNTLNQCNNILRKLEEKLLKLGYEVQTVRISTNPFGEWLTQDVETVHDDTNTRARINIQSKLQLLNSLLDDYSINFFSCGPSMNPIHTTDICPLIIETSDKFSCSANVDFGDIDGAWAAAICIQKISTLGNNTTASHVKGGLGNFRFCASSCIDTVPFFPGSKSPTSAARFSIAIGLENGGYARQLLFRAKSISNIKSVIHSEMRKVLLPVQEICLSFVRDSEYSIEYLGIDTR